MRIFLISILLCVSTAAYSANTILVVGDSLSAGYGIRIEQSWPALLQQKLISHELDYKVHNASISGQTTSEGVRQIDQLLSLTKPDLVILELGANDGLRGLSIQQMQKNLQTMITKSFAANAKVLLVGIRVPNNYGRRFGQMFAESFTTLAKQNNIDYIPFLLAPLEALITTENRSDYIQADGLHPTAKAQPMLLEHLWPSIQSNLKP